MSNHLPHAAPPAAWYDDPQDPTSFRYWNGSRWTDHRAPKRRDRTAAPEATAVATGVVAPTVSTSPEQTSRWPILRLIAALGAVAVVIGSVGPWATVSMFSVSADVNGTDGDGVYTLIGGLLILALVYTRNSATAIVFAVLTAMTLTSDLSNVSDLIGDPGLGDISVGWGLHLATAGAVIALVALVVQTIGDRRLRRRLERASASSETPVTPDET